MREILSTPSKEYPQFEAGLSLLPALRLTSFCAGRRSKTSLVLLRR
jgi:hypothetical protein